MTADRIKNKFIQLKKQGRKALVTFTMAFDPNFMESLNILQRMPANGADIIELGMPFSDPMADGPIIQKSGIRALKNGAKMSKILTMVSKFRQSDSTTPVILMGYFNPILAYGEKRFFVDCKKAGVDGVIIVDLPIEEDDDVLVLANNNNVALIKLITPATDSKRIKLIVKKAKGFIYYVAVAGVTGGKSAACTDIAVAVDGIRQVSKELPIAVGFGIKDAVLAKQIAKSADAVVVGSALVEKIGKHDIDGALSIAADIAAVL